MVHFPTKVGFSDAQPEGIIMASEVDLHRNPTNATKPINSIFLMVFINYQLL